MQSIPAVFSKFYFIPGLFGILLLVIAWMLDIRYFRNEITTLNQIAMKSCRFLPLIILILVFNPLQAQVKAPELPGNDIFSAGLGVGMDYGGLGANLLFYPQKNFGLFAGAGYAFIAMGYNGGAKLRITTPRSIVDPFLLAMYGYNVAFMVSGGEQYNRLFNGPTFGLGIDLGQRPGKFGYWSIALLVPVRSTEFDDYKQNLIDSGIIDENVFMLPVGFSFGYRMVIW